MINLFITFSPDKWDRSPAFVEKDRALTEYILPAFQEQYAALTSQAIDELKATPQKGHCSWAHNKYYPTADKYQDRF